MKIAAVVPVYNSEKWIRECINSLINQTVSYDEIIIVDDGSTDSSGEICDEYKSLNNVLVIHTPNRGLSAARNLGLNSSTSEYIMFIDSDDFISLNTVEVIKNTINDEDIYFFDGQSFDDDSGESIDSSRYKRIHCNDRCPVNGKEYFLLCINNHRYYSTACMAAYKRKLILNNMFIEGMFFEDLFFSVSTIINAQTVFMSDEVLYHRRYRAESVTSGILNEKKLLDLSRAIELICEFFSAQKESLMGIGTAVIAYTEELCTLLIMNYNSAKDIGIKLNNKDKNVVIRALSQCIHIIRKFYGEFGNRSKNYIINQLILYNRIYSLFELEEELEDEDILIQEAVSIYKDIFSCINLKGSKQKYCFYGVGKHTEGLINIFEALFGEISAIVDYCVTNPFDNQVFQGKKVKAISELDGSYDGVVISSFVHNAAMMKLCDRLQINNIINFYDNYQEDLFSWASDNAKDSFNMGLLSKFVKANAE